MKILKLISISLLALGIGFASKAENKTVSFQTTSRLMNSTDFVPFSGYSVGGTPELRTAIRGSDYAIHVWSPQYTTLAPSITSAIIKLRREYGNPSVNVQIRMLNLPSGVTFDNATAPQLFSAMSANNPVITLTSSKIGSEQSFLITNTDANQKPFIDFLNSKLELRDGYPEPSYYQTGEFCFGLTSTAQPGFDIALTNLLVTGNCSSLGEVDGTLLTFNPSNYTIGSRGGMMSPQIKTQKDVNGTWVNTDVEYFVSTKSNWLHIGGFGTASSDPYHGYTVNGVAGLSFSADALTGRDRVGYIYVKSLFPQGGGTYTFNTDSIKITQSGRQVITSNEVTLNNNTPNPFNPTTAISFSLNTPGNIKLSVYDVQGRLINTLINGNREAGIHTVNFDGSKVASGLYFYTLESEGAIVGKKSMLLVK